MTMIHTNDKALGYEILVALKFAYDLEFDMPVDDMIAQTFYAQAGGWLDDRQAADNWWGRMVSVESAAESGHVLSDGNRGQAQIYAAANKAMMRVPITPESRLRMAQNRVKNNAPELFGTLNDVLTNGHENKEESIWRELQRSRRNPSSIPLNGKTPKSDTSTRSNFSVSSSLSVGPSKPSPTTSIAETKRGQERR